MSFFDDIINGIFGTPPQPTTTERGPTAITEEQMQILIKLLLPGLTSQMKFAGEMQPGYENAVRGQIGLTKADSRPDMIAQLARVNNAQAQSSSRIADSTMRGSGLGEGFRKGAASEAMNAASGRTSDAAAKLYSPEFDWSRANNLVGAYSGAIGNDAFTSLLAKLQGIMTGQGTFVLPGQPGTPGMLGQLAQAAATYYGGR